MEKTIHNQRILYAPFIGSRSGSVHFRNGKAYTKLTNFLGWCEVQYHRKDEWFAREGVPSLPKQKPVSLAQGVE